MTQDASSPVSYSIEVSGWDISEEFFVELTQLEWCSGAGEKIQIRRPVRTGAVVFLRLVHPTDLGSAFPVAYQVAAVHKCPGSGLWELRLTQLRTRTSTRKEILKEEQEELAEQTT